MKTRILALAAVVVLALTAVAVAGTNKFSKTLKGGGAVSFKVKTNKKGIATKVTSFSLKGTTECMNEAENQLKAGPVIKAKLGSFKVKKFAGTYGFEGTKTINGVKHTVSGSFTSKKGRKVGGSIRAKGRIADKACVFPANEYSAKRK